VKFPLDDLLSRFRLNTVDNALQALREIIQEIALLGLWRGKFFEHAAFYGGTAMRIIHGLPRFSEDMDFSLLLPNLNFKLKPYIPYLEEELHAFGLDVSIVQKIGSADSAIESVFAKINTRTGFLKLGGPPTLVERLSREQIIKVKFEIDIDPPKNFLTETRFLYTPQAFSVRLFDLPSMFAGKLHAAITRTWKTRVKGRDWFDVVWFVGKDVSASLAHFKARLIQTGQLDGQDSFTEKEARELLSRRIESLDIEAAKRDVRPFLTLKDADQLNIWSKDFFLDLAARVKFGGEE
jgi:Nucleotidyl transferase AbiEii toxin, Type IV TA system